MTNAGTKVLTEALALTPEERVKVAEELLASLDGPADADWEDAWQAEIDRRAAASDAGIPSEEWLAVRQRLRFKSTR